MVVITGNVFKKLIGSDAFQEVDMVGLCEPIVKHSYFVEAVEDLPQIMEEAFYLASSGRPGPVLVDIPKCVQIADCPEKIWEKLVRGEKFGCDLPGYIQTREAQHFITENCEKRFEEKLAQKEAILSENIEKAIALIATSKKPVVIYGHGVILANAEKSLEKFLSLTQIPNVWTLHGIGAADGTKDLSLGMLGMHGTGSANFAVHHADLIIGIGIRFDDRITGVLETFQKNTKIIHFDIDPSEFGKNVIVDSQIEGNLVETLPRVIEGIVDQIEKTPSSSPLSGGELTQNYREWRDLVLEKKAAWPLDKNSQQKKFTEICVLNALYEILGEEDIVTVDVGQHEMYAAQRAFFKKSRKFLASGGAGTMGFSLPAAMGAAFTGHTVWSISGDGGIQMNIQELMTLVQDQIPVKIVILNNSYLGMVRQWQDLFYDKNYSGTPMQNPDYVKLGEAYGIPTFRFDNVKDCRAILRKMQKMDGPVMCEAVVAPDENVFPMVPQGKSLGDTMLGEGRGIF
jgi:acetolactate synthase-1/2/3 large subunit